MAYAVQAYLLDAVGAETLGFTLGEPPLDAVGGRLDSAGGRGAYTA